MVKVQCPDLVGRYLGETSMSMQECIQKAKGGILLMDKAHRLRLGDLDKDYGKEALETLMQVTLKGDPMTIFCRLSIRNGRIPEVKCQFQ